MFATHRPVIWSMCHRTEGPYHMDQFTAVYLVQGLLVWMVQGKGLWDWILDGAVQSDLFWEPTYCGSFSELF